jgi:chromosome segregation ATPase
MDLLAYERLMDRLNTIDYKLRQIEMSLAELQAEVTKTREVSQSAVVLINGLADRIDELKADPVLLEQLVADLRSTSGELGAAVAENPVS